MKSFNLSRAELFRKHHLLQLLELASDNPQPIDTLAHTYFRRHKAIGSKDRKDIAENFFGIIRWKGLLDFLLRKRFGAKKELWPARAALYAKIDPTHFVTNQKIPMWTRYSFPRFFVDRLLARYDEKAVARFLLISNEKAPLTIRVNLHKISREKLAMRWKNRYEFSLCSQAEAGITFSKPISCAVTEEFQQGLFEIQDEGSQLVSACVDPKPKDHILDYCAGSGGKTLAFAPKTQGKGQIYLYDVREHMLAKAKKRLRRAGVQNAQFLQDSDLQKKNLRGKMDWILLDVPCSGSGTLRRNPDMKWRLSLDKLNELIEKQRKIFSTALQFLKPNGRVVYATCSVFPEENEDQIAYFIERYGAQIVKPFFSCFPMSRGMDGFFAATLAFNPISNGQLRIHT